jgi:hypothetical protein
MRRRRPLRYEGKLQVINDLINDFMVFNERDDLHLTSTGRAQQRVHFIYLADHLLHGSSVIKNAGHQPDLSFRAKKGIRKNILL